MLGDATASCVRKGSLAVVMLGLGLTRSLGTNWLNCAAIICGAAAATGVLSRLPAMSRELNGFRRGNARGVVY